MNLAAILALPTAVNPRLIRADDTELLYEIAAGAAGSTAAVLGNAVIHEVVSDIAHLALLGVAAGHYSRNSTTGLIHHYDGPSSEIVAMFVGGGTQHGIYSTRGTSFGKDYFNLIGQPDDSTEETNVYGIGWTPFGLIGDVWLIGGATDEDPPLYYSLSDVATPDLATNWKNASDDTPASVTVTPVTQGELDASVVVGGDLYANGGNYSGRSIYYVDGTENTLSWNGSAWGATGLVNSVLNVAFPWQADWSTNTPTPAVTRNDIVVPSNWTTINAINTNNATVTDAPVDPPQAFVAVMMIDPFIGSHSGSFDWSSKSITSIEPAWFAKLFDFRPGGEQTYSFAGNHLSIANIDALLAAMVARHDVSLFSGSTLQLSAQSPPAPPTRSLVAAEYDGSVYYQADVYGGKYSYEYPGGGYYIFFDTVSNRWMLNTTLSNITPLVQADVGATTYPWQASGWSVTQGPNDNATIITNGGMTVYTD